VLRRQPPINKVIHIGSGRILQVVYSTEEFKAMHVLVVKIMAYVTGISLAVHKVCISFGKV